MPPDIIAAIIAFFPYLWLLAEDGWLDESGDEAPVEDEPVFGPDIFGTEAPDILSGTAFGERVLGGEGDDTLFGFGGADTISGDDGADQLSGGDGNDAVVGGDGADRVNGNDGNDTLSGGLGDDRLDGGLGADMADGGQGSDTVFGSDGADTLSGGGGADSLFGGAGNDVLRDADDGTFFELSPDTLDGGDGDDLLYFGAPDIVTGGAGVDSFILARETEGVASITDFDRDQDILVVQHEGGAAPSIASQTVDDDGLSLALDNGVTLRLSGLTAELPADRVAFVDTSGG